MYKPRKQLHTPYKLAEDAPSLYDQSNDVIEVKNSSGGNRNPTLVAEAEQAEAHNDNTNKPSNSQDAFVHTSSVLSVLANSIRSPPIVSSSTQVNVKEKLAIGNGDLSGNLGGNIGLDSKVPDDDVIGNSPKERSNSDQLIGNSVYNFYDVYADYFDDEDLKYVVYNNTKRIL